MMQCSRLAPPKTYLRFGGLPQWLPGTQIVFFEGVDGPGWILPRENPFLRVFWRMVYGDSKLQLSNDHIVQEPAASRKSSRHSLDQINQSSASCNSHSSEWPIHAHIVVAMLREIERLWQVAPLSVEYVEWPVLACMRTKACYVSRASSCWYGAFRTHSSTRYICTCCGKCLWPVQVHDGANGLRL
eukprot:3592272-Amphidinium_carterae.1